MLLSTADIPGYFQVMDMGIIIGPSNWALGSKKTIKANYWKPDQGPFGIPLFLVNFSLTALAFPNWPGPTKTERICWY